MQHELSPLEAIWRTNEGVWDTDSILSEISRAVDAEGQRHQVEASITRRVHALLKYLFGACQTQPEKRDIAERAAAPLQLVISQNVSEMGDPRDITEAYVEDEMFDPKTAEALFVMEETLHEKKDQKKPAAAKASLRDLMSKRETLLRNAS